MKASKKNSTGRATARPAAKRTTLLALAAALALCLTACGKETADRLVGVWQVTGECLTTTVSSVPDGCDLNGTRIDSTDYRLEPYPDTWTFSAGGILTIEGGLGHPHLKSGLYSVDGEWLSVRSDGDTLLLRIVSLTPQELSLCTDWSIHYTSGRYTVTDAYHLDVEMERR